MKVRDPTRKLEDDLGKVLRRLGIGLVPTAELMILRSLNLIEKV